MPPEDELTTSLGPLKDDATTLGDNRLNEEEEDDILT